LKGSCFFSSSFGVLSVSVVSGLFSSFVSFSGKIDDNTLLSLSGSSSLLVIVSGGTFSVVPGAQKTNQTKRWGIFDANNGYFFEADGVNTEVVIRSNTSGSIVNTMVVQSSWNLDKLDGTGASGANLDLSKHNIFYIEYAWHGGGKIRWGIYHDGRVIYCSSLGLGILGPGSIPPRATKLK
jgi:hypothetical protein